MLIVKTSLLSGKERSLEINVTEQQLNNWRNGELIQHVMPDLSPDEREFIMTGIHPDEWEETVGKEQ